MAERDPAREIHVSIKVETFRLLPKRHLLERTSFGNVSELEETQQLVSSGSEAEADMDPEEIELAKTLAGLSEDEMQKLQELLKARSKGEDNKDLLAALSSSSSKKHKKDKKERSRKERKEKKEKKDKRDRKKSRDTDDGRRHSRRRSRSEESRYDRGRQEDGVDRCDRTRGVDRPTNRSRRETSTTELSPHRERRYDRQDYR